MFSQKQNIFWKREMLAKEKKIFEINLQHQETAEKSLCTPRE